MKKIFYILIPLSLLFWACSSDPIDEPDPTPDIENPDDNPQEPEVPQEPEIPGDDKPTETKEMAFRVHKMSIDTDGGAAITSKENYIDCVVSIESDDPDWCFADIKAGVRGRGNSTWEWYPKKPYRIKFDKKQEVLGLGKAKSWVLLAEYRDPTDLMNTYAFEMGLALQMPFTNHNRYVWLTLNGKEIGLYHLTEQVQQGSNRVDVEDDEGLLLSFDQDDGPSYSTAPDNFWSITYHMPVCVKYPEDQSSDQLQKIREEFNQLEKVIKSGTFAEADELLDMKTFADFIIIQELIYNVELDAPRSMYIHKDKNGKWTMGPLWDHDAGFDFDWSNMYTGHRYFSNNRELVMGTNPYTRIGASYDPPKFFTDLFRHQEFKSIYKTEWKRIKNLHDQVWASTYRYVSDYWWEREQEMWNINLLYTGQITSMKNWLNNRIVYLDSFIPSM